MLKNGQRQCQADHTLFVKHQHGELTTLIVYVDDIVVTDDDHCEINHLNFFHVRNSKARIWGLSSTSLELKLLDQKTIFFYPNTNMYQISFKTLQMLGCKPCDTPIESNHRMHVDEDHRLIDIGHY